MIVALIVSHSLFQNLTPWDCLIPVLMTEEERARIKTVKAHDQLFHEYFLEKITNFNCRNLCRKEGDDGRHALAAMYRVMAQFANDLEVKIPYVSMAGVKSGVKDFIAPELVRGLFEHVFGNRYHLSLLVYPAIKCFGSFLTQVVNVSACVEDLFSLFWKDRSSPICVRKPTFDDGEGCVFFFGKPSR